VGSSPSAKISPSASRDPGRDLGLGLDLRALQGVSAHVKVSIVLKEGENLYIFLSTALLLRNGV
jgi:hypothetical protein